jgi:hypothetical protein
MWGGVWVGAGSLWRWWEGVAVRATVTAQSKTIPGYMMEVRNTLRVLAVCKRWGHTGGGRCCQDAAARDRG